MAVPLHIPLVRRAAPSLAPERFGVAADELRIKHGLALWDAGAARKRSNRVVVPIINQVHAED